MTLEHFYANAGSLISSCVYSNGTAPNRELVSEFNYSNGTAMYNGRQWTFQLTKKA